MKHYTLLGLLAIALAACNGNSSQSQSNTVIEPTPTPPPTYVLPENAPMEALDDPDIWDEPRVTFWGEGGLYTANLDMTQVRRVISEDELRQGRRLEFADPTMRRSPNHRYLAGSFWLPTDQGFGRAETAFIDLKTRDYIVVDDSNMSPGIAWDNDSQSFLYWTRKEGYHRYWLESGKKEKIKSEGGGINLTPLPNGDFMSIGHSGYAIWDKDLNELYDGTHSYHKDVSDHQLSPDKKYLYLSHDTGGYGCFFDLTKPDAENKVTCSNRVGFGYAVYPDYTLVGKHIDGFSTYKINNPNVEEMVYFDAPYTAIFVDVINYPIKDVPEYYYLKDKP